MTAAAPYEQGLKFARAGRHAEAIACFEQALTLAPSEPKVLFALGNTAKALGMAKPAEAFFRQVLALEPGRIEALVNLANLLRAYGDAEAARQLLEPALAREPENAELWLALGSALRDLEDAEGAEAAYRTSLEFTPGSAAALANLADMLADKGQRAAALKLYDRALRHAPDNVQAKLNRAVLHLLMGNLKDGWRDYAVRLKVPGKAPMCDHGLPAWTGAPLKNKRLLVTAEQGVGDEIMFASMIHDLAARAEREGGRVILECEARLVPLFARSFPDVTVHASARESRNGAVHAHYGWLKQAGGANLAVELGSLPRFLRNDIAKFPAQIAYFDADEIEVLNWQRSLASAARGPFIGICWRSGKMSNGRARNFAPLEMWAQFLRELPGTPVSVQYDASTDEIEKLGALSGRAILVPGGLDQKQELDRAAALFASLDAVVSAPTAVSWLSAAVGTPTFKIVRDTSWTSFGCDYEPFAPSCRVIMPAQAGDWADCFEKARRALNARL